MALEISDRDGVRTVVLNRPEALNAFNGEQFDDLTEAFLAAAADPACRALVLTGRGRAFSAGADLTEMSGGGSPATHGFRGFLDAVLAFEKPFLLAINGLGVGIGATVTGLADFTYMAAGARLKCPFSELGLVAEAGSTRTFPALMGRQKAMWFLMSSEWMSADECVEAGLALETFPDDALLSEVQAKAAHLAALPLESLAEAKRLIVGPTTDSLREAIAAENAGLARLGGGAANREALAAFREKRKPDFSGM